MLKIPAVTAIQRSMIISDALFFSVDDKENREPISVFRHGIRGTQNQNSSNVSEASNLQVMESAKTNSRSRYLDVEYSLRALPVMDGITSCSGDSATEFRNQYSDFIKAIKGSNSSMEVALRMARNIFNGRWLWRNRQLGVAIEVSVTGTDSWTQDSLATPLNQFGNYSETEKALAKELHNQLFGLSHTALLVNARIDLGASAGSVEVYPSQNYSDGKPSKGFGRALYKVDVLPMTRDSQPWSFEDTREMGLAAIRDQKVWNAIRTIDTWYGEYPEYGMPISVEPLGANLGANTLFRKKNTKTSLFNYLEKLEDINPESDEAKFVFASFIRGGVMGGETAEKAAKKEEDAKRKAEKKAVGNVSAQPEVASERED